MQLGSRTSAIAQSTVTIPKPGKNNDVTFKIQALPIGFDDLLAKELPEPSINKLCDLLGYMKDPVSGKFLKENGKPIREYDLETPKYKKEVKRKNGLQLVAMVYHAIKDVNPDLKFSTKEEETKDKAAFYDSIKEEFAEFGLSTGDVVIAVNAITKISNLSQDAIEEAKEDFLEDM